jgi:YidC/Oxa1 family membrane protein insertase
MPPTMNPNAPNKGMEKRLLLAFALMMLVLFGTQYFFHPAPAPKTATPITPNNAAQMAKPPATAPNQAHASAPPVGTTGASAPAEPVEASAESTQVIDTDVYHIVFTNKGAVVKDWFLKHFRDSSGKKQLDLVNESSTGVPLPFAIDSKGQQLPFDPNQVLYAVKPSADKLGLTFEYASGNVSIRKSFRFGKDSYLSEIRSEVLQNGSPLSHVLMWRGGFGDQNVRSASSSQHTVHYDTANSKLITKSPKDVKDGPLTDIGDFTFGGVEDKFFAAVALPPASSLEVRTYADDVKLTGEEKPEKFAGVGFSTGPINQLTLFAGPKDTDLLREINPKLEKLINWGFFGIIAKPLFLSLNWINNHWTFNYGWAIVVVTLIINLVLFPFKISQLKSGKKMQALQPRLKAINEKYKGLSLSDPRKAQQNQETMALYKEAGVNPLGGCLPLLIQLPFLYAFYQVLSLAIEMRGARWLWVSDLSQPETLAIHILPIILIASQFLAQRMTPATGMDPNQQKIMMFMPLMYGFMFYYASAGLVLYWLTSNLAMIAQQLLINRMMPVTPSGSPPSAPVSGSKPSTPKSPVKRAVKK